MHYAYTEVTDHDQSPTLPHEGWGIDRGPKRILFLVVVDKKEYDFFPHERKGMDRGRKRISPCTKKVITSITAGRGKTRMCPFCLKHFSVGVPSVYSIVLYVNLYIQGVPGGM